jgi:hypothetical protein
VTPRCFVYGEAAGLAAQNVGRTGPVFLEGGGNAWASLLAVALLLATISGVVAAVSARQGMRRLAWGWTVACVLSLLAAAYGLWRVV